MMLAHMDSFEAVNSPFRQVAVRIREYHECGARLLAEFLVRMSQVRIEVNRVSRAQYVFVRANHQSQSPPHHVDELEPLVHVGLSVALSFRQEFSKIWLKLAFA